jgi:hypothetical protein
MHTNHAHDSQFREVPHAAPAPAEGQRIAALQKELGRALERAGQLERRGRTLERELRRARRALARCKAGGRRRRRELQIELLAVETRYWALEEVCRALVLTIEQAACSEVEEPALAAGVTP